jgi:hypothetical protein
MNQRPPSSETALRRGEQLEAPGPTERPKMRILEVELVRRGGKLRGFTRIELPNGLRIGNIALIAGVNGPFAALPAKPLFDHQGKPKLDLRGRRQFVSFLEWRDRDLGRRFSDAVIALVLEKHPGALDPGAP